MCEASSTGTLSCVASFSSYSFEYIYSVIDYMLYKFNVFL